MAAFDRADESVVSRSMADTRYYQFYYDISPVIPLDTLGLLARLKHLMRLKKYQRHVKAQRD